MVTDGVTGVGDATTRKDSEKVAAISANYQIIANKLASIYKLLLSAMCSFQNRPTKGQYPYLGPHHLGLHHLALPPMR